MARSRSIKPGFFKNENLAECGPHAMLLFAGLWTLADREGRLEDRPKRIRAEIFPYWNDADADSLLQVLADAEFIIRYETNGFRYIAIPTWDKHQNPHCKEQASTIPAPCKHGARTEQAGLTPLTLNPVTDSSTRQRVAVLEFPEEPPLIDHHPETTRALVEIFPDTDQAFVRSLIQKCVQEVIAANKRPELVSDEAIAEAIRRVYKRGQNSAGLFLTTVPNCIKNWATTEA